MHHDAVFARANVLIEVESALSGALLSCQAVHNLAVTAGRNLIRDLLHGDAVDGLTHIATGTDGTAPAAGDTALGAEVFRGSLTDSIEDTAKLTVKLHITSTQANGNTLREAGVFNAAAAGTMYARVIHEDIVKTAAIRVTYTWDLTWGVA